MKKIYSSILTSLFVFLSYAQINSSGIPAALKFMDGKEVQTVKDWEKRRKEIKEVFDKEVYGIAPKVPNLYKYTLVDEDNNALDGKATRKIINLYLKNLPNPIELLIYYPNHVDVAPTFLGYNFCGNHTVADDPKIPLSTLWVPNRVGVKNNFAVEESRGKMSERWPVKMIVDAGYALVTLYNGDIDPDYHDEFKNGVHALYKNKKYTWGTLSAWAWGLSYVMNYLEQDARIDASKVAVLGHSRLGKAALLAGANDERFALVISNESGCGGAAISRIKQGERFIDINTRFPHWFCDNFKKYNEKEDELAVDQHLLIALTAPRPVYVASAEQDRWADPKAEFTSAYLAGDVYKLYGYKGLKSDKMPDLSRPVHSDRVAYHIRYGKHNITQYDWKQFIKFANKTLMNHPVIESEDQIVHDFPEVPAAFFEEADSIAPFWIATVDEVNDFLNKHVQKGEVRNLGVSAGGRTIKGVFYGTQRENSGTTTFSGATTTKSISTHRGKDYDKTVYLGIGGVHGFELEGIVGTINLISVLETGKDLRGEAWPEIEALKDSVDRIILIPLLNPDGRARIPIRMESHKGHAPDANFVHQYLNTGGKRTAQLIGWPAVKEFIPMNFDDFEFPGGYPNDNGVNIMHDDFFGKKQPETQILFDLVALEKPDLIINMHTGVGRKNYFMEALKPMCEYRMTPVWESFYIALHTELTKNGMQKTNDLTFQTDFNRKYKKRYNENFKNYNLNTALNLHCGALSVTIESPCHGYSGIYDDGTPVIQTPEILMRTQLTAHQAAMRFLIQTGGRAGWEKGNY